MDQDPVGEKKTGACGFGLVIYASDVRELFSMVKEVRVGCKVYLQSRYLNLALEGLKL